MQYLDQQKTEKKTVKERRKRKCVEDNLSELKGGIKQAKLDIVSEQYCR